MDKSVEVHCPDQLQSLRQNVRDAARLAREALETISVDPWEALHALKFEKSGYHPIEGYRLNFVEQLNQTFTIMASLAAAQYLLEWFPSSGGLRLNLGTASGRDIESIRPKEVEAEVFASVHRNNNAKLKKEIQRLEGSDASNRYVFFYAPSSSPGRRRELEQPDSRVRVWALSRREVT